MSGVSLDEINVAAGGMMNEDGTMNKAYNRYRDPKLSNLSQMPSNMMTSHIYLT